MVALSGAADTDRLIRRAGDLALRSGGELVGVHVVATGQGTQGISTALEDRRRVLESLGGTYHEIIGSDIARALTDFAASQNATQIVVGASRRSRWSEALRGSVITDVIRNSGPIDVHIISHVDSSPGIRPVGVMRTERLVPRRRQILAWLLTILGLPLLTVALVPLRDEVGLPTTLLLYLTLVVGVSVTGGALPATLAAVVAFLLAHHYFTEPIGSWVIHQPSDLISLVVFLAVATIVSMLVRSNLRRSREAIRARNQATALTRAAVALVTDEEPLSRLVGHVRDTFGLEAVAILSRNDADWHLRAVAGDPIPTRPDDADHAINLGEHHVLTITGRSLASHELEPLEGFAAQLTSALDRALLEADLEQAARIAEANDLRAALLRAVSHDLNTPLASIKAAVTSLRQTDVVWSPTATREFLATIEEEADRLIYLVSNLLAMSRLEAGALEIDLRPIGLDEVVAAAVSGLTRTGCRVRLDVPDSLPPVRADAALLERALANLVANACNHTLPNTAVHLEAYPAGQAIELHIIDHGRGVPPSERERIFEPFQRLDDTKSDGGSGLGLAVARGFLDAMNIRLRLSDTPGGGLTVTLTLEIAQRTGRSSEPSAGGYTSRSRQLAR
ncbi:MAG: ATP-binding protein [Nitriliruptorales bacterium]